MALELTQNLTEMSAENCSWEGGGCVKPRTSRNLTAICEPSI
jgi:hypothetical protein